MSFCIAAEYPLSDKDISGAVVELKGRYPDKGRVSNERCRELAYIIKGFGTIVVGDRGIRLKQGDLVLIEPKEKFFWKGNLVMFTSSTPPWYPEQHKKVKEIKPK